MSATKKNKKSSSVSNIVKALETELKSGNSSGFSLGGGGGNMNNKSKMAGKGKPMFGIGGLDLIFIGAKRPAGGEDDDADGGQQQGQQRYANSRYCLSVYAFHIEAQE